MPTPPSRVTFPPIYPLLPSLCLIILLQPESTLFPYTTLFRSPTGNVPKLQVTVPAFSTPPLSAETKLAPFGTVAVNVVPGKELPLDRKSTRLNSSQLGSSYAVFCLKRCRLSDGAASTTAVREMEEPS